MAKRSVWCTSFVGDHIRALQRVFLDVNKHSVPLAPSGCRKLADFILVSRVIKKWGVKRNICRLPWSLQMHLIIEKNTNICCIFKENKSPQSSEVNFVCIYAYPTKVAAAFHSFLVFILLDFCRILLLGYATLLILKWQNVGYLA